MKKHVLFTLLLFLFSQPSQALVKTGGASTGSSSSSDVTNATGILPVAHGGTNSTALGTCLTNSGAVLNLTANLSQQITGSTNTASITANDSCSTVLVKSTSTSAVTFSIAAASTTGLTQGFAFAIENHSTFTDTITPTGSTINGNASFTIPSNSGCTFFSDSNNYQIVYGQCSALPITTSNLPVNIISRTTGTTFDGQGTTPGAVIKPGKQVPYSGTITKYCIYSDISGSAVIDIWKTNNAVPTIANTITASVLPTLSSQQYVCSSTLTGWTTSVSANDQFWYSLNSATTLTSVTIELFITPN